MDMPGKIMESMNEAAVDGQHQRRDYQAKRCSLPGCFEVTNLKHQPQIKVGKHDDDDD